MRLLLSMHLILAAWLPRDTADEVTHGRTCRSEVEGEERGKGRRNQIRRQRARWSWEKGNGTHTRFIVVYYEPCKRSEASCSSSSSSSMTVEMYGCDPQQSGLNNREKSEQKQERRATRTWPIFSWEKGQMWFRFWLIFKGSHLKQTHLLQGHPSQCGEASRITRDDDDDAKPGQVKKGKDASGNDNRNWETRIDWDGMWSCVSCCVFSYSTFYGVSVEIILEWFWVTFI